MKTKSRTISVNMEVPLETVESLMCSAFEGGSNYWCSGVEAIREDEYEKATGQFLHEAVARGELSEIKVHDSEEGWHYVVLCDVGYINAALQLMAEKYPRHFADAVRGQDDATTGDVFFQCLVFGEVIYG